MSRILWTPDAILTEPGLYDNVPHEVYLAIPAASASRLKLLKRSAKHMHAADLNKKETEALRLGRIIHAAVLEPVRFGADYVVMPDYAHSDQNRTAKGELSTSSNTKFVIDSIASFEAANAGHEIIAEADRVLCVNIVRSLHEHAWTHQMLEADGIREQTILWVDEETGVLCKARSDIRLFLDGMTLVCDLKTTMNASKDVYERELWKYRLDMQAAFYLDGLSHFMDAGNTAHFVFIAIEKTDPFGCNAFRLDEGSVEKGRASYKSLLPYYKQCQESQIWPGYGDQVVTVGLPTWAFAEEEE